MVKVYGASDDLVEIQNSKYEHREIGCYDASVRIWFTDGTVITVGYNKPNLAIWYIKIEQKGNAEQQLLICEDENADIYSDIFEVDAEVLKHEVVEAVHSAK